MNSFSSLEFLYFSSFVDVGEYFMVQLQLVIA